MAGRGKFDDLNLSKDEISRIGEALKKEEFRKLLVEYAEEISDPENKRRYEEEIAQMENERGMDISFINPNAGYVLKTSVDGEKKAFINICTNDKIDKPSSEKQTSKDGRRGLFWNIPHSFAPPKEDVDKEGRKCNVYDVVYHPDTFRMAETNKRFRKMMEDIALDGIEKNFNAKLDRSNVKRPKIKNNYKGVPQATVVRTRKSNSSDQAIPSTVSEEGPLKDIQYPYDNTTTEEKMKEREENRKKIGAEKSKNGKTSRSPKPEKETHAKPKYTITHRSDLDLQEYRNAPDAKTSTRPKELEIKIELPLITSASAVALDVFEKNIKLESKKPAAYKLDLNLPYAVDENEGSAKFDKSKRCLIVTLPVLPSHEIPKPNLSEGNVGDPVSNGLEPGKECSESGVVELDAKHNGIQTNNGVHTEDEINLIQEVTTVEEPPPSTSCSDGFFSQNGSTDESPSAPASIFYSFPPYTYHQDKDTVTFVLSVRNVLTESITKSFPSDNVCHMKFISMGTGYFPMHYSFYVKFADPCKITVEHCTVDVSDDNLVLLLLKKKSCRELWDGVEVGKDETELEEKLFVTQSTLQRELEKLESEVLDPATMVQQNGSTTDICNSAISVTQMNEKKLTIKIKKSGSISSNDGDEGYEADWPSSADIEVVHSKAIPNMHSILKQRTVSESSDDYLSNSCGSVSASSSSPRYCSDDSEHPLSMRKKVSFNDHIDHTTYKPALAVTTMKSTLKNKRRHARKKEEKKKEKDEKISRRRRRRQNSGGSSSGDDQCSSEESKSESQSEEQEEASSIKEEEEMASNESKATGDDLAEEKSGMEVSKTVQDIKKKLVNCENSCEKDDSDDEEFNGERTTNDNDHPISEADKTTHNGSEFRTNIGNENGSAHKKYAEGDAVLVSAKNISQPSDVMKVIEANCDKSVVQIVASEPDACLNPDGSGKSGDVDASSVNKSPLTNGDSVVAAEKVETILSWNDGPMNKPQCPMQLSNSVMFDLDID